MAPETQPSCSALCPLPLTIGISISAPYYLPGALKQLSVMLLRRVSQREDPQHRNLSPHRLGEDHPDRAHSLLHRQDSRDPRGGRSHRVFFMHLIIITTTTVI